MQGVPEFTIERDDEAGVFVASWDDPAGGGITTQAKDLRELASAIEEAVRCHFAGRTPPREVALHFADNPVLQLA
jgi:predicted RNase H-like HicB family nuclease